MIKSLFEPRFSDSKIHTISSVTSDFKLLVCRLVLSPKECLSSLWWEYQGKADTCLSWRKACVLRWCNPVRLLATLWTTGHQAPLPMGFSWQEYWSGLPCPPPGGLPNPGIKLVSLRVYLHWQVGSLPLTPPGNSCLFRDCDLSFKVLKTFFWFVTWW